MTQAPRDIHMRRLLDVLMTEAGKAYMTAPEQRGFWLVLAASFAANALAIESSGDADYIIDTMPHFADSVRTLAIERALALREKTKSLSPDDIRRLNAEARENILKRGTVLEY